MKDYTWGGSTGYLNPKRGATPARFKTTTGLSRPTLEKRSARYFAASTCASVS